MKSPLRCGHNSVATQSPGNVLVAVDVMIMQVLVELIFLSSGDV